MATREQLLNVIAGWEASGDIGAIQDTLTASPDRYHLAFLCLEKEADLPEPLVSLVDELIDTDPLFEALMDLMLSDPVEASDDSPTTPLSMADWAEAIKARPDSSIFQKVLAEITADFLYNTDEEAPQKLREQVADIASQLARNLAEPTFAFVFLAHAHCDLAPVELSATLRECWGRAKHLAADVQYHIASALCALIDVDEDPDLALEAAQVALAFWPSLPTTEADPDDVVFLHLMVVEALARTDRPAALRYAAGVLADNPEWECTEVAGAWALTLLTEIASLAMAEAPASDILPLADDLARHRARWPQEDEATALLSAVLARVYLVANRPRQAGPWLREAERHYADVPDYKAEVATLQLQEALQLGDTDRLERDLRAHAQTVGETTDPGYHLNWLTITEAWARLSGDTRTLAAVQERTREILSGAHDSIDGTPIDDLRAGYEFSNELMAVWADIAEGKWSSALRDTAVDLCRRIPAAHKYLGVGAHLFAGFLEGAQENETASRAHFEEVVSLVAHLRQEADAGLPMAHLEITVKFISIALSAKSGGWTQRHTDQLRALRDEALELGSANVAYQLSRALMHVARVEGDWSSVLAEGIRALAYHTRRAATVPDARERALLRSDMEALVCDAFRAALSAGKPKVAAELLEVARAQPIPLARESVPRSEQSMMRLVSEVLTQVTPDLGLWEGDWGASEGAAAVDPGSAAVAEESELLLADLPPIRMPWGRALDDALADITRPEVAVLVRRSSPTG